MVLPRVLVFEYFTGGGWPEANLPPTLLAEGRAILQALLTDLRAWGGATVVTTCDRRLPDCMLPADHVMPLEFGSFPSRLLELAATCQAALLIAPESDGLLASLSQQVQDAGPRLLGSQPPEINTTADKAQLVDLFSALGLPTPQSWCLPVAELRARSAQLGWPLVVKPLDGVGAQGVSLLQAQADLTPALALLGDGNCLLQRYVPGVHASVSLLAADGDAIPLSLNEQWIRPGIPFTYSGGRVPLDHPLRDRALALARQAVLALPGLAGYVGVDLVLGAQEVYLIEINPRLTTSYIGLRQVTSCNLAAAIWQACTRCVLPESIPLTGEVSFGLGADHV